MSQREIWKSVHTIIDPAIHDRDSSLPDVELTMRPMGTQLPVDQQQRELDIQVGRTRTILDEEGIQALKAFLEELPR